MKQNDWIVASLNNPTYDQQDFQYLAGLTLENTQFLPKEDYLKSSFIRNNDIFKDKNGEFSEDKFKTFYDSVSRSFSDFSTNSQVDTYQYDIWDTLRPENSKIKSIEFTLSKENNPQNVSIGISGINEIEASNKSMRELAQDSKIYDPSTGKFLEKSVNELSLFESPMGYFKSIFGDPLVYATYDEDTEETDPITGNKVLHKKGEWKVNDHGEYYVEKLNGRSLIGKQVVSAFDYITSENTGANKYDFFDSDDLDKSIGGNIIKNITAVLPMFIPYVGTVYSGLLVGREVSKSLPMIYGMVNGLTGDSDVNSKLLNTISAYGQTFTGSSSDYAQENTFSFENFANLMSDVALQWGQQRLIAESFSKLTSGGNKAMESAYAKAKLEYVNRAQKTINDGYSGLLPLEKMTQYIGAQSDDAVLDLLKTGKWVDTAFGKAAINKYIPAAQKALENRMRIGQDLSLVYMAMVSNTDVYEAVLENGGTPFEAASIALGSMLGMFSVDKYLGLGEMFFNEEPARKAIRDAARKNAEDLMKTAGIKEAGVTTKKGIIGLIQKGIDSGKKAIKDYHGAIKDRSLGFIGKSLGEGLEEVSEELVADLSKTLGEVAGKLGYFSQTDYGAWENAFDRYTMSLLGGAAGGGLFYVKDAVTNRNKPTKEFQSDLVYLLRQGRKEEILAELTKLRKQGKLGSKNLSYKTTKVDGNYVYLTAENEEDSQNQYVYDTLVKTINQLDFILNDNQLNLTEDELFDKMVQGEYRATALSDFLKGKKEDVKDLSYITSYQQDFQELSEKIINKESEIQEYIASVTDPAKRNSDFQEKLNKLKAEKQALLDQKEYLFGEGSLGYVEKMLFAMDTNLSGKFLSLTWDQYVRHEYKGKSVQDLTEAELQAANKSWEQYKNKKRDLDEAFKLYKEMEKKINPTIQAVGESLYNWELQSKKSILALRQQPIIDFDSKLEGESDEDYNDRNTQRPGETTEQFKARQLARRKSVYALQEQRTSEWINSIAAGPIDRNQFRIVQSQMQVLKKNLIQQLVRTFHLTRNPELTHKIWSLIEQSSLEDIDGLKEQINQLVKNSIQNRVDLKYAGRSMFDDFTWDNFRMKLQDLGESTEGYLTYGDMYKILESYKQEVEETGAPYDPEGYLKSLSNDTLGFDPNSSDKQDQANADFMQWYGLAVLNEELREAKWSTPLEITPEYLGGKVNSELQETLYGVQLEEGTSEGLDSRVDNIVESILNNPLISSLSALESKVFSVNPVADVVNAISKLSSNSEVNINDFLESIYKQYQDGENAQSFQLTDEQEKVLSQFINDLGMSGAFINAASVRSSYDTPVGHNKGINQFVANHRNIFTTDQVLPEMSEEYANFLLNELASFELEARSWIELSQLNASNKARKFTIAEEQYTKVSSQFYKTIRDSLKVSPEVDLLDGYETIPSPDSVLGIAQTQQLLYNNYRKALAKGISIEQILDKVLPEITNINELPSQLTSKLDENLDYSKLTSYDKLTLLINSFALSPKKFYSRLKQFIEDNQNLAPLSIQEVVARTAQAQQEDPELINKVLDYLSSKLKLSLPILKNTSVVLGLGGAGKTAAIAKISTPTGKNTWLCGPTQSQVDTLINSLPDGKGYIKEQLMATIMGSERYEALKNSFTTDKNGITRTNGEFGSIVDGLEGNKTFKLKESVTVNKVPDAPKLIIIDEATHFSTAELQVISKFAELNGSQVLLLGDDHQNGYIKRGAMMNLDREVCLTWRTPKLFISLRDNNTQKSSNLSSIINLIDKLDNSFNVGNEEDVAKSMLREELPHLFLSYYNKESFKGELVTKQLSLELINKLTGSVAFIGASTSPVYQQLLDNGKNPTLIDPVSVQGQEFDYVIVDKSWNLDKEDAASLYFFLRDFYTMISRSREGTILIEQGDLSRFRSVENELTGVTSIKKAINNFREQRIPVVNAIEQALVEGRPTDITDTVEESDVIRGTQTSVEQLEPEVVPVEDNSELNNEEQEQSQKEDDNTVETVTTPIRCYSNVSYSGIPLKEAWTNNSDIRRDLGIFVRKGDIIRSGKDKRELVRKLLQLKCVFNYGTTNWNALPKDIRERFTKETFDNSEYFVSVEDPSDNNQLVGLTDLDPDKRTINGKVVTLVAKIKDRNGEVWEVTLGGLANPQTWKDNESKISKSIEKRIQENDPKSEELRSYLDDLHKNIIAYENRIAELTRANQQVRINKPQFSGLTTLVKSDTELRLESIDPESVARPFDATCQYAVKSDVYVLTGDIPGVSPDLRGKAVMYVSSNLFLDPSQLRTLYEQQKNDPSLVPQVRMIVLDNMGVSFDSLYRKKYQDIYTVSRGDTKYYFPFEAEPMGLRMYKAVWNFRANLKEFLKAYNTFKEELGLSQEDIIKLCRLDNQTYNSIRGDQKYISEQEYRNAVDERTKQLLKPIWDFNDSLKDYREFRLGYSTNNGAYLRKLTNLSEDGPYQEKDINNVIGIYINPDLAEQYSQILDNLFSNILEKIVPSDGRDSSTYITKSLSKGWFEKVSRDRKISINMVDYSEDVKGTQKVGTLSFENDQALSALPSILVETAKFLEFKSLNHIEFEEYLQQNPNRYIIKFGDEVLNWWGIDQVLEKDRPVVDRDKFYDYSQFPPGVNPYEIDDNTGEAIGIIDERLSNMFNLMFHGLTSTKRYNDLTKDEIRATDAEFKYGFFTDPVLAPKQGTDNTSAPTITNHRLFGAKVYPGLPIIGLSLDPYTGTKNQQVITKPEQVSFLQDQDIPVKLAESILEKFMEYSTQSINFLKSNGISFTQEQLENIQTVQQLQKLVNKKIISKFKKFWSTQENNLPTIINLPFSTFITSNEKLDILPLSTELRTQDDGKSSVESAYWDQNHLIVTMTSGKSFTIDQTPSGVLITPVVTSDQPTVSDMTIDDLGTQIKQIIDNYTQPNNEDGLDQDSANQLIGFVDRVVKKGKQSDDVSIETKNRIINEIQEALQYTDLEDEINNALTKLKNVCKLN